MTVHQRKKLRVTVIVTFSSLRHLTIPRSVGVQWKLRGAVAHRDHGHPPVPSSNPPRRRAFCPDSGLGSSNRPFSRRRPRSNGSAREPPGPHLAGGGETPLQPHGLHPPEGLSGGLGTGLMSQSAVVRDYRALEVGRRRTNRLVLTVRVRGFAPYRCCPVVVLQAGSSLICAESIISM